MCSFQYVNSFQRVGSFSRPSFALGIPGGHALLSPVYTPGDL